MATLGQRTHEIESGEYMCPFTFQTGSLIFKVNKSDPHASVESISRFLILYYYVKSSLISREGCALCCGIDGARFALHD